MEKWFIKKRLEFNRNRKVVVKTCKTTIKLVGETCIKFEKDANLYKDDNNHYL